MQGLPQALPPSNETSSLTRASGTTVVTTEGRPVLSPGQTATGQVLASEPLQQGQGHRVQVQLSNGQQINLIADKPMQEGQQLQLTGRAEGQVEVRVMSQAAIQQAVNNALIQLPTIKVQLATGQTMPLQPGQAVRAEVLASQPATNGQGYNLRLQLPSGQQVNLNSNTPLPVGSQVHLNHSSQGNLEVRTLNREVTQLLDQLKLPLTAVPASSINKSTAPPASLQNLLASASAQLRHALPRQAPLGQALQQLNQLVRQLPTTSSSTTSVNQATTTAQNQTAAPTRASNLPATQTITTNTATSATPTTVSSNTTPSLLTSLSNKLTAALNLIPQGNQTPSATSLQQFIPFSGLLLEANVLRGVQTNPAGGDLKLLLQQASSLLRQGLATTGDSTPRQQQVMQQLAQQVQSAEARIQVMQQTSLQATQGTHERGQPAQIVQMDLPYSVRGEWFQAQLEIRRWIEEKDAEAALEEMEKKTRSWEVNLSFTLKNWGKIHTLLRLKDEQLKADIWVEVEDSYLPIKNQAELLAARLRRIGADVEEVTCHLGEPPPVIKKGGYQQIIDTRI